MSLSTYVLLCYVWPLMTDFVREFRCSLPGCRWRAILPADACEEVVARALLRIGWRADEEDEAGLICGSHGREPYDA
jgi:hypothetical protein